MIHVLVPNSDPSTLKLTRMSLSLTEAMSAATKKGYTKGAADGYEEGYTKGTVDGYEKGHTEGVAEGYAEGLAARTYETWTITLVDGTIVEKEVALL